MVSALSFQAGFPPRERWRPGQPGEARPCASASEVRGRMKCLLVEDGRGESQAEAGERLVQTASKMGAT
jgi:hypothetical protein